VLLKGVNDDEAIPLLRHALENDWNLRFIEQMPLDAGDLWARPVMVTADDIQSELEREFTLTPVPTRGSAPAEEFYVNGGPATVGIIASVTRPFCSACDRLRLTADGQFRNCLFARDETDVRGIMRSDLTQEEKIQGVRDILQVVTKAKLPGHGINDPNFIKPDRPMSAIGG
jgi:GTP 3',8-cyclase